MFVQSLTISKKYYKSLLSQFLYHKGVSKEPIAFVVRPGFDMILESNFWVVSGFFLSFVWVGNQTSVA